MSTDLLLSLGHNASAIAIVDGDIVNGYEEERLSGIKSDSHFPIKAITAIGIEEYDNIHVSHWDPFGKVENMSEKHWQPDMLPKYTNIKTVGLGFTHHDAHHLSARAFAGKDMPSSFTIVADGFGNFGEVLSVYDTEGKLVNRTFGYQNSLGLMYQYAVANLGMKMNEDEYKLLGYEVHITQEEANALQPVIQYLYRHFKSGIDTDTLFQEDDPLYDLSALVNTQLFWDEQLEPCNREHHKVAFVVQSVLEMVLIHIVTSFNMMNVNLVGGVFLNVKGNNAILENIEGKICVMPLSGDQGAAIGLYKRDNPDWEMPPTLCFGKRPLSRLELPRTENFTAKDKMGDRLCELLLDGYIVNIICGDMEFGPRALCHTSTIALPTMENVEYINKVNGRDTVMPMGPVISETFADNYFPDLNRVVKSDNFMVIALKYHRVKHYYRGAAHILPLDDEFTGRPQVLRDPYSVVWKAVQKLGILINTSFNIHGVPIVYSDTQLRRCIEYQQQRDEDKVIYNLVLYTQDALL